MKLYFLIMFWYLQLGKRPSVHLESVEPPLYGGWGAEHEHALCVPTKKRRARFYLCSSELVAQGKQFGWVVLEENGLWKEIKVQHFIEKHRLFLALLTWVMVGGVMRILHGCVCVQLLAVPTERLVVTRSADDWAPALASYVWCCLLFFLSFSLCSDSRCHIGKCGSNLDRITLTKSQSSAELLFICSTAAQLTCCGVLGGQGFNRPQQGPVSQPTLPEPVPGLCSV